MTTLPPPLPGMPRLRKGKTVKDACDYLGIEITSGMTMDDIREEVGTKTREADPRRSGDTVTTVEQAERMAAHWATAPFEGCGNVPLMSSCEAVCQLGDCPGTKYCVFAPSLRETTNREHWRRNGWAEDAEATAEGLENDLCPFWDPDERIDNTDDYLLPVAPRD